MTNETQERRPETPAEADGTTGLFIALGKQLRLLRERKGLKQREFGELAGYGPDAIGAMERGVRVPRPELLEKADELLDAQGLLIAVIPEVREAMKRARTRHPEWYRSCAALEAEAVELHFYANQGVPGLLQTEDYARAVFSRGRPLLDVETIERRVTDRLDRQRIFTKWPSPCSVTCWRKSSWTGPSGRCGRPCGAVGAVAAHRRYAERGDPGDADEPRRTPQHGRFFQPSVAAEASAGGLRGSPGASAVDHRLAGGKEDRGSVWNHARSGPPFRTHHES